MRDPAALPLPSDKFAEVMASHVSLSKNLLLCTHVAHCHPTVSRKPQSLDFINPVQVSILGLFVNCGAVFGRRSSLVGNAVAIVIADEALRHFHNCKDACPAASILHDLQGGCL